MGTMPKVMNGCWTGLNWITGKRTVASSRNASLADGHIFPKRAFNAVRHQRGMPAGTPFKHFAPATVFLAALLSKHGRVQVSMFTSHKSNKLENYCRSLTKTTLSK